jgi:hypothetical protein
MGSVEELKEQNKKLTIFFSIFALMSLASVKNDS